VGFEARPVKTRRRDDTVATGWDWQTGPHPPLCLSSARPAKFQPSQTRVLQADCVFNAVAVHDDGSYTQHTWSSEPRLWCGTFTRRPWSPITPVSSSGPRISRCANVSKQTVACRNTTERGVQSASRSLGAATCSSDKKYRYKGWEEAWKQNSMYFYPWQDADEWRDHIKVAVINNHLQEVWASDGDSPCRDPRPGWNSSSLTVVAYTQRSETYLPRWSLCFSTRSESTKAIQVGISNHFYGNVLNVLSLHFDYVNMTTCVGVSNTWCSIENLRSSSLSVAPMNYPRGSSSKQVTRDEITRIGRPINAASKMLPIFRNNDILSATFIQKAKYNS
jgi:hypothetical protein